MKYPQLVSMRAVSAISDWLVNRLEQLGVEAPIVYSRLLLSLLHTPLQINALDLAELPQLKSWIGRRGGTRRLTQADTEQLKRIAAVQSLMEVVSADQKKSIIEDLVNELCEKLHEIEKSEDGHQLLQSETRNKTKKKCCPLDNNGRSAVESAQKTTTDPNNNNSCLQTSNNGKRDVKTIEYYQAFPALASLDSESQQAGDLSGNSKASESTGCSSSAIALTRSNIWPSARPINCDIQPQQQTMKAANNNNTNSSGVVKKKQKKRRSSGMVTNISCNAKNNQSHLSANNYNNNKSSSPVDQKYGQKIPAAESQYHQLSLPRDSSLTRSSRNSKYGKLKGSTDCCGGLWDTNFTGTWEMEYDPIKEFMTMQNDHDDDYVEDHWGRNRRHSDSDIQSNHGEATAKQPPAEDDGSFDNIFKIPRSDVNEEQTQLIKNLLKKSIKKETIDDSWQLNQASSFSLPFIDIQRSNDLPNPGNGLLFGRNIIRDEGYATPDTLTSQSEVDSLPPKRLYEREPSSESLEKFHDDVDPNLVKFKAKFNRNVEQIWNNATAAGQGEEDSEMHDIHSFWQKYHKHRYDFNQPLNNAYSAVNDDGYFYKNSIWSNSCGFSSEETAPPTNCLDSLTGSYAEEKKKNDEVLLSNMVINPNNPLESEKIWLQKDGMENFYSTSLPPYNNYLNQQLPDENALLVDLEKESCIEQSIAMLNHSKTSSFIKVNKTSSDNNKFYSGGAAYKAATNNAAATIGVAESSGTNCADENLLTSDRTHFRPIKQTYLDGHTFDIPGSPDNIEYVRSASGSIFFDLEKYMEYNIESSIDEQNPTTNVTTSSDGFDDETTMARDTNSTISSTTVTKKGGGNKKKQYQTHYKFTLKFCVKQNEKYCQTEIHDFERVAALESLHVCPKVEDIKPKQKQQEVGTTFDVYSNEAASDWKNLLKYDDSFITFESLPANRLMRDELSADGEEILSDLKYMQNLYIGGGETDDEIDYESQADNWYFQQKVHGHHVDEKAQSYYNILSETVRTLAHVLGEESGKTLLEGLSKPATTTITAPAVNAAALSNETNEIFWHKNWSQQKWSPMDIAASAGTAGNIEWSKCEDPERMVNLSESVWNFDKHVKLEETPGDWEYSNLRALWTEEWDVASMATEINAEKPKESEKREQANKCCQLVLLNKKAAHLNNPQMEHEVVHIRARKRRHSASQNLNDELEFFDRKYFSSKIMDYCKCDCNRTMDNAKSLPSTTIITCKYLAANVKTMLKHQNKLLLKRAGKSNEAADKKWLLHNFNVVSLLNDRNEASGELSMLEAAEAMVKAEDEDSDTADDQVNEDTIDAHFFPMIHHHHPAVGSIFGRAAHMVAMARPLTR